MICLEIIINGKRICLAGVGDTGVVGANLAWTKRRVTDGNDELHSETTGENLFCIVGGLAHLGHDHSEHLRWLYQKLVIGDEVTIRIVEAQIADQPYAREGVFDGCGFCGKPQSKEMKVIVGAGATICKDCTEQVTERFSKESESQEKRIDAQEPVCSFCGRSNAADARIIAGLHGNICSGCLETCYEALHQGSE